MIYAKKPCLIAICSVPVNLRPETGTPIGKKSLWDTLLIKTTKTEKKKVQPAKSKGYDKEEQPAKPKAKGKKVQPAKPRDDEKKVQPDKPQEDDDDTGQITLEF